MKTTENVQLSPRLDLSEVKSLAARLLAIESDAIVLLDAKEVTYFGSLCAQAIIAGARRSKASGGQYKILNLNERSQGQLMSMGLTEATLTEEIG